MPNVSPRVAFAAILVANCIVWSQSNYGRVQDPGRSLLRRGNVLKRGLDDLRGASSGEKEVRSNMLTLTPFLNSYVLTFSVDP